MVAYMGSRFIRSSPRPLLLQATPGSNCAAITFRAIVEINRVDRFFFIQQIILKISVIHSMHESSVVII